MVYVLIALCLIILALHIYFLKWRQIYTLTMLIGKKGSGKSTMLVRYMMRYHKKGYRIYTTMDECTLPYAIHIDAQLIGQYVGKPKSLLTIDEAGILFDNRKYKSFRDEWRDYFKFQRHYCNVVVMASQAVDIDLKLRNLIDYLYILNAIGPICIARKVIRKITLTEADGYSDSRIADQLRWDIFGNQYMWIPRYQRHFASFSPPERPFFIEQENVSLDAREKPRRGSRWKFRHK